MAGLISGLAPNSGVSMPSNDFESWLKEESGGMCVAVKTLPDGIYGAVKPLLFHWTFIIGEADDRCTYLDRFCYQTEDGARAALDAWDGTKDPQGWHRHPNTGRRRPAGDPLREYIAA
jgi:hypothetical protein